MGCRAMEEDEDMMIEDEAFDPSQELHLCGLHVTLSPVLHEE